MDVFTKDELSCLIDQLDSFVEKDGHKNGSHLDAHSDFLICECFCLGRSEVKSYLLERMSKQDLTQEIGHWSDEKFKQILEPLKLGQGCGKCLREREAWMELFMASL